VKVIDLELLRVAAANHGLLTTAEARAAGLTAQQWQRRRDDGTWLTLAPGVWRHAAHAPTWEMRVRAGLLSLGPDAALAGRTAAAWWGLDGFPPDDVEFIVPRERRQSRCMTVHTTKVWSRGDLLRHDGLRVTSATRTIIDLALYGCTARQLEHAVDSAIRMRCTSVPTLLKRMDELGPRRGIRTLRAVMLDAGGESFLERRFLRLVRRHRLPPPATQVIHRRGGRVMRVDFQFDAARVVVEVSGRLGHTSDSDRQRDARRRNALQDQGWTVLEFTSADVLDDPDYVIEAITTAISRCRLPC
jgi:very-short-patch-repair endonuclease